MLILNEGQIREVGALEIFVIGFLLFAGGFFLGVSVGGKVGKSLHHFDFMAMQISKK